MDGFCVPGIMLEPEDGTLHIDRIAVEDEGLYTCQATNERGSVESSAYVSVESKREEVVLLLLFTVSRKRSSVYCKSAHLQDLITFSLCHTLLWLSRTLNGCLWACWREDKLLLLCSVRSGRKLSPFLISYGKRLVCTHKLFSYLSLSLKKKKKRIWNDERARQVSVWLPVTVWTESTNEIWPPSLGSIVKCQNGVGWIKLK